jgi:hypothetical protein
VTGLAGLIQDQSGGYLQPSPYNVGFGVSRFGQDILATTRYNFYGGVLGAFFGPTPLFAGESLQFPGLDQVNLEFPTCPGQTKAQSQTKYDAWLPYTNSVTGTSARIYVPFEVRPGDPDCAWTS